MTIKITDLQGKRAAVLGIGLRSGVPLIRFLVRHGCAVTAFDKKSREQLAGVLEALQDVNVELVLGEDYLNKLSGYDYLFKTPIMRPDLPEIEQATGGGAVLSSEIELVFDLSRAPITAVTGSDGKTTTTTLIYEILKHAGKDAYLGGNVGHSLIEQVEHIDSRASIVLELSSFQLMPMVKSPHVSVMTNLSPNHLDVHNSYEEYIAAKENIWRYQSKDDFLVLNWDDSLTRAMAERAPGTAVFFSRREEVEQGVFVRNGVFWARFGGKDERICQIDDLLIKGVHNWENVAAAAAACMVQGVSAADVAAAVIPFKGVEHRLELVRELSGAKYYNDSSCSSPTRTSAGLTAIGGDIVLIAGGSDKYTSFDDLGEDIVQKVRAVALIGQTAPKIAASIEKAEQKLGKKISIERLPDLRTAVKWCHEQAREGTSVLLSPACASFDMFKDFEDRGRQFKKIVKEL